MAGEGGGTPIIRVPIDTAEFDAFVDKFMAYQKMLETQGDAWAGTNKGIRQQKTAFDDVDKSFSDLVAKATDNKFSGPGGSFVKVQKSTKETEKSWKNIARDLEKSAKSMSGLARSGLSFSALGGLGFLGAAASAAGGLFAGVKNADNSLAAQNIANRRLDLRPGEEKAFDTVFEKAGGDTSLLSKIAAAKSDPSQWRYLQAAGVPLSDIQNKGTEELSEEFLKKVGGKVRELGPQHFGMWAESQGVTNFADVNSLRQAGSYSDADYARMHNQYKALQPQLAAQQKDLDAATAARAKIEADLARDALALDLVFIKFNPLITGAADAFANWITKLSGSGELDTDIKNVTTAFEALGTAAGKLSDALDWLADKEKPSAYQQGQVGKGLMDAYHDLKAGNPAKAWEDLNRPIDGGEKGRDKSDRQQSTTEDRYLDATKAVESNNGKNLVGPVTAEGWSAIGPYQFSPANVKRYHVSNPFDEAEERDAARRMRADLRAKYGDNEHEVEAAYNWGEGHVDEFLKKHHGQFDEQALPKSVQDYIHKIDKAVAHGDQTPPAPPQSAQKTAKGADKPQIMPAGSADQQSLAAQQAEYQKVLHEGFMHRMVRAANMVGDAVNNSVGTFGHDSGVTQKRIDRQGSQPNAPYSINVHVTTPAGNSTVITSGGLAQ